MYKIVVPIDFSETSKNAARYAGQMAKAIGECGIVLYNVYDVIPAGSDGTPLYNDEAARNTIAIAALGNLKLEIEQISRIPITCMAEPGDLVPKLEKLVKDNQVDLVVMGINGATRLEQVMIGSSTLGVINRKFCPVIIVPPDAKYQRIRLAVLLSDLRNVEENTPIMPLRNMLNLFRPELYIVHVQSMSDFEFSEEYKLERSKLEQMLSDYNPEFVSIPLKDFLESIDQVLDTRKADLVILLPHKHAFLNILFKSTHTKKLAYHTHVPILALQDQG